MKKLIYIVAILFLGACSSHQFHTTRVLSEDFSRYKTYGWLHPVDSLSKDYFSNDIARANIIETANRELEARGMTYSKANPDILFRYIAIVNNKSRNAYYPVYAHSPWGYYHPWAWHRGPWRAAYPVGREAFRAGHIIIEARDAQSETVIWQARGSLEVDTPERAINSLPKIVSGVMEQYPVQPISR